MSKQLRPPDLAYLDALVLRAGATTERLARNRKWYRAAVKIDGRPLSVSRASRHYAGDRHSPAGRVLFALEQLTRGEGTTAWPLIAEGIALVIQCEIRTASTAELEARLRTLDDEVHGETMKNLRGRLVNGAPSTSAELEKAGVADLIEAEFRLERAAILRELGWRKRE